MNHIVATISRGSSGTLHLLVWGERYRIPAEDAALLAILGRKIPVYPRSNGEHGLPRPAGFAYPNVTGHAVQFSIGTETYHISRDLFLALCLGEIASAPLYGIVTDDEPVDVSREVPE
jgi:hypothetical protein